MTTMGLRSRVGVTNRGQHSEVPVFFCSIAYASTARRTVHFELQEVLMKIIEPQEVVCIRSGANVLVTID
jgi:hypothetical protein